MIQVTCPHCGLQIQVPMSVQGRRGTCFGCGALLVVPKASAAPAELNLDFTPGERIADRYVCRQPIGRGGMGAVYLAEDTLLNELVAL